jgi:phosphoglycolate phosphatase-like HAD superfamily hydrolase
MAGTVPTCPVTFARQHDFLVAVDSDGCAMDTMTFKHLHCFTPQIIRFWRLESIRPLVDETEQFVNLYSKWRGLNRFPALLMVLDLLRDRPEVAAAGVQIPPMADLRAFCPSKHPKSNTGLKAAIDQTGSDELRLVLDWSNAVNASVAEHAHEVKPFPSVRAALAAIAGRADLIVVSQMPQASCRAEWTEHGLSEHVAMLGGQELGTKAEQLRVAMAGRYPAANALMIGDAPGDLDAARANGVPFFPTVPGREDACWHDLIAEGFERFVSGRYVGSYQDEKIKRFQERLPERPPWVG